MATIHRPTWQCWREKTPDNVSCCRAIVQFQRENSGNAGEKDSSDAREKDSSNSREKNSPSPCIAMKKCNHHLIVSCYYLFSSISLPLAIITNNYQMSPTPTQHQPCQHHQHNNQPCHCTLPCRMFPSFFLPVQCHGIIHVGISWLPTPTSTGYQPQQCCNWACLQTNFSSFLLWHDMLHDVQHCSTKQNTSLSCQCYGTKFKQQWQWCQWCQCQCHHYRLIVVFNYLFCLLLH